jgi:hypothetical protein
MSQQILLISRFVILLSIFSLSTSVLAQKTKWRYVQTIVGGVKVYLKDDFQKLKNKHLLSWDKRIQADGSHAVSQIEWDCQNKQFLTKAITMYEPDNALIGTSTKFNWKSVLPIQSGKPCITKSVCRFLRRSSLKLLRLKLIFVFCLILMPMSFELPRKRINLLFYRKRQRTVGITSWKKRRRKIIGFTAMRLR